MAEESGRPGDPVLNTPHFETGSVGPLYRRCVLPCFRRASGVWPAIRPARAASLRRSVAPSTTHSAQCVRPRPISSPRPWQSVSGCGARSARGTDGALSAFRSRICVKRVGGAVSRLGLRCLCHNCRATHFDYWCDRAGFLYWFDNAGQIHPDGTPADTISPLSLLSSLLASYRCRQPRKDSHGNAKQRNPRNPPRHTRHPNPPNRPPRPPPPPMSRPLGPN